MEPDPARPCPDLEAALSDLIDAAADYHDLCSDGHPADLAFEHALDQARAALAAQTPPPAPPSAAPMPGQYELTTAMFGDAG